MNATVSGRAARRRALVLTLCGTLVAIGTSACGPPPEKPKTATVKAGTMPSDASWDGVYFSPLFGYLHLKQDGGLVVGRWERPRKDRWGELKGNANGNLLRFDWTEYNIGLVGPNSRREGKGYLVYQRPEGDNVDDVVNGAAGLGENELGMPWKAVKQRNVTADVESIGGTGASDIGGGDWDGNKSDGAGSDVEAPKAPDADGDDATPGGDPLEPEARQ